MPVSKERLDEAADKDRAFKEACLLLRRQIHGYLEENRDKGYTGRELAFGQFRSTTIAVGNFSFHFEGQYYVENALRDLERLGVVREQLYNNQGHYSYLSEWPAGASGS